MSLLFSMLPFYLLGNFHCIGMCGPLVMMIGQHRYRYFYFLGRTLSFTLAGMIAGEVGAVFNVVLSHYHIPTAASFLFGSVILLIGIYSLGGWHYPGHQWMSWRLSKWNQRLAMLMLQDNAWFVFLFGFLTLLLPCGQTLIVFSACALSQSVVAGMVNGFAFAILTSPSLFLAMKTHGWIGRFKNHYHFAVGVLALMIATLAYCRGLAELNIIPHWILNPNSLPPYHIVLY